jgi:hypothetical protein
MNDVVVNYSQSVVVEVEERGLVTKEEVGGMDDSRSENGCNFLLTSCMQHRHTIYWNL